MTLIYTSRIEKALRKASFLHEQQRRKGDGSTLYITHPMAVALILSQFVSNEDILVAGILHDTIEDTGYSFKEMTEEFGEKVSQMVKSVSEDNVSQDGSLWRQRKEQYLCSLHIASEASLLVALADKIHNLTTLMYDYEIQGESFLDKFYGTDNDRMWFFGAVLEVIQKRFDHPLVLEYKNLLFQARKYFLNKE